jgi:hypothetical protein
VELHGAFTHLTGRILGYIGGVGLPSPSSSFSFPELLLGFPMAHPSLLALFLMRVRGR